LGDLIEFDEQSEFKYYGGNIRWKIQ